MTISIGDKVPDVTFKERGADGTKDVTSAEIFNGKKIVLFAVPGAFTPTCHLNHLPGYLENRDAILAKGVDEIVVIAVNDPFVMQAWAKATGGEGRIRFLSDSGAFAKAVGMDADMSGAGMGVRSKRYSMIAENGRVTAFNPETASGAAVDSGAARMLEQL